MGQYMQKLASKCSVRCSRRRIQRRPVGGSSCQKEASVHICSVSYVVITHVASGKSAITAIENYNDAPSFRTKQRLPNPLVENGRIRSPRSRTYQGQAKIAGPAIGQTVPREVKYKRVF